MDYQKAFDTVNHGALWKVMKLFGYGEKLIQMIRTLYQGATSCIINNGYTTSRFQIGRSCRQGDCVSPYLFLLIIEPLLCKLRQILPPIQTTKGPCSTVFAYADDCNCVALTKRQLRKCLEALDQYAKFSGLEINKEKSEIMPLPDWRTEQPDLMGIQIVNKIKITGTIV